MKAGLGMYHRDPITEEGRLEPVLQGNQMRWQLSTGQLKSSITCRYKGACQRAPGLGFCLPKISPCIPCSIQFSLSVKLAKASHPLMKLSTAQVCCLESMALSARSFYRATNYSTVASNVKVIKDWQCYRSDRGHLNKKHDLGLLVVKFHCPQVSYSDFLVLIIVHERT